MTGSFAELQQRLPAAWNLNRPGNTEPHVVISLPSFSVGESLLSHYADRVPALEHRYLLACLMLGRIHNCRMAYVTCRDPGAAVVDYYMNLLPAERRDDARSRLDVVVVDDSSSRSVATKLLDNRAAIEELRSFVGDQPAFIEPWNVTDAEVAVALELQIPINGTDPSLWHTATKSSGRRLFAAVGVPLPEGLEDVHTVDDVLAAIASIRNRSPLATGVVIKHDDSGAGDGNATIDFANLPSNEVEAQWLLRQRVETLPEWYLRDLLLGGIVEERIVGEQFSSPSAQVDVAPDGGVVVLATHEQVLGGPGNQVYLGCQFPADPAYSPELARHAHAIGERLAALGVCGRFSLDFVAARTPGSAWRLYALEINLRKGGTTHPYCVLRNLVPGSYDAESGVWWHTGGPSKFYCSTDNLISPNWLGLDPSDVIAAVTEAGLTFDGRAKTGVVLHMLSCLAVDGRLGLTAIAHSSQEAIGLQEQTRQVVASLAAKR
ncbi:MAG: hypothetical protein QOG53_2228 [Frankiales bacterium]|nr:hypothetical protein [Frankiales bacterium]